MFSTAAAFDRISVGSGPTVGSSVMDGRYALIG